MLFKEMMKQQRVGIEKRIFCVPEKEPHLKKEPTWEENVSVTVRSSQGVKMEFSNIMNNREVWFSDQKSFRTFVDGLNEVVATMDAEIKL